MRSTTFTSTCSRAAAVLLTIMGCLHSSIATATEYEVTNTSNSAATSGSLPWAVAQVNAGAGTGDVITFNIPGTGPFTIALASPLTLSKKACIDGTTQPGYSSSPLIVVSGGNSVNRFIFCNANYCAIKGLVINGFTANGITLASSFDTVSLCYIGTDATGTAAVANATGISVGGAGHVIGGIGAGNVISGNTGNGIDIGGVSNIVQSNYIGLNAGGTSLVPNARYGISFGGSANSNIVGGTAAGTGNVIAGGGDEAIVIHSKYNIIQGNILGMDAAGTTAMVNRNAIWIDNDSNRIGGGTPGAGNYIVSNAVDIYLSSTIGTMIQGNYFGLNKAGTQVLSTSISSRIVVFSGCAETTIGGTAAGEGNVFGGIGSGSAINVGGSCYVYGNIIGFDPTLSITMGFGSGISLDGVSNVIGGTGPGEANIIANNGKGIRLNGSATNNKLSGNSIYNNSQFNIDFENNGVTLNDMPDVNGVLNFPVITSIAQAGGNTTISGNYDGKGSLAITLEFFSNNSFVTSGYGGGQTYIGNAVINTDASGHAIFSVTVPGTHNIVSATASATGYNTSEFSRTGPLFVNGSAALNVCKNSAATDIKTLLHALDPHIGATLTWENAQSPSHGSLTVTSATASSGGSDITPGGTITYKPTAGYAGTDAFRIRITDSKSSVTMTVTVTVHDPAVTASNNGPVCNNSTLNINGTVSGSAPSYTYTWSGPNSFSSTTEDNSIPGATTSATGIYTLVVADMYGCRDTGTTSAIVTSPDITGVNNDGPVCAGSSLNLTAGATGGTGALAYAWSGPNGFANTGAAQEIASAPVAATGTYTLIVTDVNSCADTGTTMAAVTTPPVITAIGTSGATCEDNPLSLFSTVSGGTGSYTYAWTGPNSFSSADEDPLVSSSVTTAANGTYELTVTDDNNCTATGVNTTVVTVYDHQPITGEDSVMFGTTITLSNPVGGGTWSTPTPWRTSVSGIGVVKGVSAGISSVSYTTGDGCISTHTVTVLSGNNVCVGQTIALTDTLAGGTWISNYSSIASVSSTTGIVKGIAAGRAVITHRTSTGIITTTVTVHPLAATSSLPSVCQGQALTLTNSTPGGGTWYSGNTAVAAVSASGIALGTEGGTATIYFTPHPGCATERVITVIPVTPITGPATVCMGQVVNMSNSTPGGAWSTSAGALAQVNAAGVVKGMSTGTPRVSYIWPNGCHAVRTMTVNTLSQITGGTSGICASSGMTLANATPFGGVWSSSNSSAATVNPTTGFVKGTGVGTTTISFTTTAGGCIATRNVTVNACREGEETTSVSTITTDDVKLYPNPNNGQFTIAGTLTDAADSEVNIEVVNMLGQVIYRDNTQVNNRRLEKIIALPGNMPSGTYMLALKMQRGNIQLRFVIQ